MNEKSDRPLALPLLSDIQSLIQSARRLDSQSVNTIQDAVNYEIGRRIVEHEQQGSQRAEYGDNLILLLSQELSAEFGCGFSERNLRKFYTEYSDRIPQSLTADSTNPR